MHQKAQLMLHLQSLLAERIAEAERAMAAAQEARNSDTKSSAGDKYETGRAMMQMEIDKLEAQLGKAAILLRDLQRVDAHHVCTQVEFGSLVLTDEATYFMAIGLGKVDWDGRQVYAISLASPIGQALAGKRVGEAVQFQGRMLRLQGIS